MLHNQSRSSLSSVKLFVVIACLISPFNAFAQWTINLERAKNLVVDTYQPTNIITGDLPEGGLHVVWMDRKESPDQSIFIQTIDINGRVKLRADGKKISGLPGKKDIPVLKVSKKGTAYVLWKDFSYSTNGDLYLQKVGSDGSFEWGESGIISSLCAFPPVNYSMSLDAAENSYIAYIEKIDTSGNEYDLRLQKVTPKGERIFGNDGISLASCNLIKSSVQVLSDTKGGAYVLWLESHSGKNIVQMKHVDKSGNQTLFKKQLEVTPPTTNVISYQSTRLVSGETFIFWQVGPKSKEMYYTVIANGVKLFQEPKLVTPKIKTSKSNLVALGCSDSTAVVGFITEKNSEQKDFVIQKISRTGNLLWGDDGEKVNSKVSQKFSASISADKFCNIYAAWIEKEDQYSSGYIYGQKLNQKGKLQWDASGTPILLSKNTEKSYVNSFADKKQGMVVIFREGRKTDSLKNSKMNYSIYGQRLYAERNAVSVIADLSASVDSDSIMVSWRTSSESKTVIYKIEMFLLQSSKDTTWTEVASLSAKPLPTGNDYSYKFVPDSDGVYFIRIVQMAGKDPIAASEIRKVSYIKEFGDKIVVLQNNPNPVSDSTEINFYLPAKVNVKLEFYNSKIEKLDEINLANTVRGRNSYIYSGATLPEGIYFFRFTAGNFRDVKKFVVAR